MTALEAIQLIVEKKAPKGWQSAVGIYANFSRWPHEVQWYAKCPKCGKIHGDFKSMREAHAKRLCGTCDLEAIEQLKKQVAQVNDPDHKVKTMADIVDEGIEPGEFDPFEEPPEELAGGVPLPPEDEPIVGDTKSEIDRILLGNWVDRAVREFADDIDTHITDVQIDERQSRHYGYDPQKPDNAKLVFVDVGERQYIIFKDYDEGVNYAEDRVRDDLRNEPTLFGQDWLSNYVDEEKLKAAIGDPYENWEQDEIGNLDYKELLNKMVEEGEIDYDDSIFFKKSGDPRVETPARSKRLDGIKDKWVEEHKPTLEDPWQWLEDIYGKEEAKKEALKMAPIDIEKATKDAIATDGWVHFVHTYDGHSHELGDGAIYCRLN